MSEIRASEIKAGQTIDDYNIDPFTVAKVDQQHGDTVLITDTAGVERSFDIDEVVDVVKGSS